MGFKRTVEDFGCERCGAANTGDGYTNHCRRCLYSKHVDVDPGDRASDCGGLMAPVDVRIKRNRCVLVHRCDRCGAERPCRTSPGDDLDVVLRVMRDRAERFLGGDPGPG